MFIEVADEPLVLGRPFQDKITGMTKPAINKQKAYLHSGVGRYPVPFQIRLSAEMGPYQPGFYLFGGDIFKPGEYDGLKFFDRDLQLVRLVDAMQGFSDLLDKVTGEVTPINKGKAATA
jgi:hypothetical protein